MLLHGHTMRELWVGVYSILRIFQKTYQGIYLWSQTFSIGSYRIPTIPTVSYRWVSSVQSGRDHCPGTKSWMLSWNKELNIIPKQG